MRTMCSWCGKEGSPKDPFEDTSVSHGICPPCAFLLMELAEMNTLHEPDPGDGLPVQRPCRRFHFHLE